jgi:hypothetical protein
MRLDELEIRCLVGNESKQRDEVKQRQESSKCPPPRAALSGTQRQNNTCSPQNEPSIKPMIQDIRKPGDEAER